MTGTRSDTAAAPPPGVEPTFGALAPDVQSMLDRLRREQVVSRIWKGDHTLWKPVPTEIANRLGWLRIPLRMRDELPEIDAFVREVREAGYTQALLLGMGGSSLAPEVFRSTFGVRPGHLDLAVLDSTDPGAVLAQRDRLDPARALFIVSTKSGGTVETFSFFRYFYRMMVEAVGADAAGAHFIAITDPGSALADAASAHGFRKIFLNDPDIGGRYSALSHFGLVPAALVGVDVGRLLDRAIAIAGPPLEGGGADDASDPSAYLGAVMGAAARRGRDKVTLVLSPQIASFGGWAEQLIAESTGKEGRGIVPVDGETLGHSDVYGADRLFVQLRLGQDDATDEALTQLVRSGHPLVRIHLADAYDLGRELFRWEMATAVAGWCLGINPFDQPDVESAKVQGRRMIAAYEESGSVPGLAPTLREDGITAVAAASAPSLEALVNRFLGAARPGDYIAIQAYVQPTASMTEALQDLRHRIRDRTRLATTLGYGPRFLHSTGQLHKGDSGKGNFLQIVGTPKRDAPIPDSLDGAQSHVTFGVLERAQSLGDRQALLDRGRRVLRLELDRPEEGSRAVAGFVS